MKLKEVCKKEETDAASMFLASFKRQGLIKSGPDDFDRLILAIESFTSCGVVII
jgi:hypothetical protein